MRLMATYGEPIEDMAPYEEDYEANEDWGRYVMVDHPAFVANGGLGEADGFEDWLRYNIRGQFHRARIDAENA